MRLIFLTFALVLLLVAAIITPAYEPWRVRCLALGLAFYVAASYPF